MKPLLINLGVVFGVLMVSGTLMKPFKDKAIKDMREDEVLPVPLSLEKRNELGQAGYAAALGGLRPVLASYYYLKAHNEHVERDWYEMEKTYNAIVAMQPKSDFYWEMAGWQLAVNTSSLSKNNQNLDPLERERRCLLYIERGDDFLKRGLEEIPDSYKIARQRIDLLTDSFRVPNFEEAMKASSHLLEVGDLDHNRRLLAWGKHIYIMLAIEGNEVEAYHSLLQLWDISNSRQLVPALRMARYLLEDQLEFPMEQRMSEQELFMAEGFGRTLADLFKFQGQVAVSEQAGLVDQLKKLYEAWHKSHVAQRDDAFRVKIYCVEQRLKELGFKGELMPEGDLFFGEADRKFIESMVEYRKFLTSINGKEAEAYERLKALFLAGRANKFQKFMLAGVQLMLAEEIKKEEKIELWKLCYSPQMKYSELSNYWNSVNSLRVGATDRNIATMKFRPTAGVVRELREFEERFNVPEKMCIKDSDIYTPLPN